VYGGNLILTLQPRFRTELLAGTPAARGAWGTLGETVRFLKEHEDLMGRPALPFITAFCGAWCSQRRRLRICCTADGASPALASLSNSEEMELELLSLRIAASATCCIRPRCVWWHDHYRLARTTGSEADQA